MLFIAPYSIISTGNLALHFHPEHVVDLRRSGLNDETIRAAGVYSLRPADIGLFFRRGVPPEIETALCFPYQGGTFARIKLFPAFGRMKYAQPPGTSVRLYMPFRVTGGDIYVCEGEKKTLAAHQAGFNVVGIGGLWNWLQRGEPIGDLRLIDWVGREVTIIPDSDGFRVDLLPAVYALACELRKQDATVYVAQIPQLDGAKVGLDDFIVAGGELSDLEIFSLGHRIFRGVAHWHRKWKIKKALTGQSKGKE